MVTMANTKIYFFYKNNNFKSLVYIIANFNFDASISRLTCHRTLGHDQ